MRIGVDRDDALAAVDALQVLGGARNAERHVAARLDDGPRGADLAVAREMPGIADDPRPADRGAERPRQPAKALPVAHALTRGDDEGCFAKRHGARVDGHRVRFDPDMVTVTVAYPGATPEEIEEGICIKIEEEVEGLDGVKRITSSASENFGVVSIELFDTYRGSGVPAGHRSLAYRLRLQAPDRSLTDTDIAEVRQRVVDATVKFDAQLRS